MGIAHREAGQYEQAEGAYRRALAMWVQQKDRAHEADSLNELGNLYDKMGRLEEAVTFYWQAADIYDGLGNLIREGTARNNAARTLIKLKRYDEARPELRRAIECMKPYGHAAEPWKTWNILYDLEQATGNPQAAAQARQQAIQSYLAYRRAGGVSQNSAARLYSLVTQAIQQGNKTEAKQLLAQYLGADAAPRAKALIPKLQAILNGDRRTDLADDPDLYYSDAAELQLLLERLWAYGLMGS